MNINRLDWDSNFFNIEIAEVILDGEFLNANIVKDFDMLYVKSNSDCSLNIEGFKQSYQEIKYIYSKKDINNLMAEDDAVVSIKDTNLKPVDLYELAYLSGVNSRFNKDDNFTTTQFKTLYQAWIHNSIKTDYAHDVLVYKTNKSIGGFVTYSIKAHIASIGLIAVDANFQGLGIGKSLIYQVMNSLIKKGVSELHIPTQKENINACNFYRKLDFKISRIEVIKHFWKQ